MCSSVCNIKGENRKMKTEKTKVKKEIKDRKKYNNNGKTK